MNFSAVLLAGGESRRMGRDKANIKWRDRPLWEWQIDKLRALQPEKIFVSARTRPPWLPTDAELVVDFAPSRGPLSGLAATLAAIETEYLAVLAIDMPFMTTEHLRHLCSLASNDVGVVPMIKRRAEPLAAVYPKGAESIFAGALRTEDFSVQSAVTTLIAHGVVQPINVDEFRELYRNVNEPGDLKETA